MYVLPLASVAVLIMGRTLHSGKEVPPWRANDYGHKRVEKTSKERDRK